MEQIGAQNRSDREGGISREIWTFLTAMSGVEDELERARLTATGLPSLLPCSLSGVALADEAGAGWTLVLQEDGRQIGPPLSEDALTGLQPLFEEALQRPGVLIAGADRLTSDRQIPPSIEKLGARSLALAPLMTLRSQLGVMFLGRKGPAPFSREDTHLLSTVGEQSAIAIENLRLHRKLKQSTERLQQQNELILGSAGEGIYGLDDEGRTTFVNPAAIRMLGWTSEEVMGKPAHDVHHHTRADGSAYPRAECPIYAAFKDGKVHRVDDEVFWCKDGSSIPVEYTSTPIRQDSRLHGAVVVFRDITERKQAEEKLRRALSEVEDLKNQLQAENSYLREEVLEAQSFGDIVGQSPAVRSLLEQIDLVAPTDASVLILGESGTGKELVAREIHKRSERRDRALIRVNCASIPRELYESEFFGHVRGAFTGAVKDRAGRFEAAHAGTLFLDEVGEIPLELQSKLLRVLQEGEYERVGEERTRKVDVRIVAASNRNLKEEAEAGRFRQDLYYRFNVFPIEVVPLRSRIEDVPPLADHFLSLAAMKLNLARPRLTQANILELQRYDWPGNVRELQNVIERALITSRTGKLRFDLPEEKAGRSSEAAFDPPPEGGERQVVPDEEMRRRERENIRAALEQAGWKIYGPAGAAELLDIKPTTLASRMKKMGIRRPR